MKTVRSHCTFVLAAVALSVFAAGAHAALHEWSAIGPVGADVRVLAVDGANVYAGAGSLGVLKSQDDGAHWTVASDGLADASISALAVDALTPSTLYAGTSAGGLFKSVDAGAHWLAVDVPRPAEGAYVSALASHPKQSGVVYAATSRGVFKSTDGASTWNSVGPRGVSATSIALDPNVPDTIYVAVVGTSGGTRPGIYKSLDAGSTWTRILPAPLHDPFDDPDVGSVYVDSQSRVYVSYFASDLVVSNDAGTSWSALRVPFPATKGITAFAVDDTDPRLLYVGTFDGEVFASSDAGQAWTSTATLRATTNALRASKGSVLAATSRGVYTSADAGRTWTALDLGVRRVTTANVAVDPAGSSTVYVCAGGMPMKSTDSGQHWSDLGIPAAVARVVVDAQSPSTLYALTDSAIYKSTDAGNAWTPLASVIIEPGFRSLAIARSRPSTLYAGIDHAVVIKSTDGGSTWTVANRGLIGDFAPGTLVVDPANPDVVVAIQGLQLFRSLDGGANWQAMKVPAFTAFIGAVAIDPAASSTYYVALNDWDGVAGGVLKSTDAGASWSRAQAGIPPDAWINAFAFDPSDRQRLYAATTAGVFRSVDAGTTWAPLNTNLPDPVVNDLAVDASGKVLRAGTTSGLFEYRFANSSDVVTVVEYYYGPFDHYFMTGNADEIANLDNGVVPGWVRTGFAFNAFAKASDATVPVCRFFSTGLGPKISHFYSPFAAECAAVGGDPHWMLETNDAFDVALPSATGACAPGLLPVYRFYNNGQGGAPNHRYTTDGAVRAQMIARGWVPEGLGPDAVQMCAAP